MAIIVRASTIVGSAVPNESGLEYWLTQQRLLSRADRCIRFLWNLDTPDGTEHSEFDDAFRNLGLPYARQSKMAEPEKTYQRALKGEEKALGARHAFTPSPIRAFLTKLRARWRRREGVPVSNA